MGWNQLMIDLPRLSKMCPIYAENAYFIILILDLPRTPVFAGVFLAPLKRGFCHQMWQQSPNLSHLFPLNQLMYFRITYHANVLFYPSSNISYLCRLSYVSTIQMNLLQVNPTLAFSQVICLDFLL
jgi:hypothetical protein